MRNNTKGKRLAPALCAGGAILFLAGLLVLLACGLLDLGSEDGFAFGLFVLYGGILLAMILGVAAALIQRLRELDRGEEENARKY